MTPHEVKQLEERLENYRKLQRKKGNLESSIAEFNGRDFAVTTQGTVETKLPDNKAYSNLCWQNEFPSLGHKIRDFALKLLKDELEVTKIEMEKL